ncbi:MAG TPA: bifunctional riboflavin kinase/FAD synthetase [Anaerolineae bacterium]
MSQSFIRVNDLTEVPSREPTFLAIGSFDGVHRGHQAVLKSLVAAAGAHGARAAALTFFPHPKRVIQNVQGPYYITTLPDRVQLLAEQGLDLVITHPFNEKVRYTRAADFVDQLCRYLDMRQLWGGNFALGYQREGNVAFLSRLGQEKGYTVKVVEAMATWSGEVVSSSRVRHSLAVGDIEDVNGCLGRPYHVSGIVIEGDKRGRTIGFPTANLQVWEELLLPAKGVYATYAWIGKEHHVAATNVGIRPTVDGRQLTVEAHLLDFDGDLYGQELRLEFMSYIRPELKFSGLDALKAQIQADVAEVRRQMAQA